MLEVKFEDGMLPSGVRFEWAVRDFGDRSDLIMHFFLGQKKPVPEFFEVLHEALVESVPHNLKLETAYTEELDGHDVVIMDVDRWKSKAMVGFIGRSIAKRLKSQTAIPQGNDHGQSTPERPSSSTKTEEKKPQDKSAPIRLD